MNCNSFFGIFNTRISSRPAFLAALLALGLPATGSTQTPAEWVKIGQRVHGEFRSFLPVGIRIGQDALQRLEAKPGELSVIYNDGAMTPCACVADGLMMATSSTPGRKNFAVSLINARREFMGSAIIQNPKTGKRLRYEIPAEHLPRLLEWDRKLDPLARFNAVMKMENLFVVSVQE